MTLSRVGRTLLILGLGALAGAVLPESSRAQVPVRRDTVAGRRDTMPTRVDTTRVPRRPVGRDTIRVPLPPRADSVPRGDTTRAEKPKTASDTIKPPITRAPMPVILEIGAPRIYDRAALFATGALTVTDLLGRVPGLTELTTGWLGAPASVASLGDVRRVRLFLDGMELDPLDPRQRGAPAANDMPLATLEELRIERGSDEVRVYARTWRVDRTTPYTRADVATGDQNTNLYRAFFGRRFAHGEAVQLVAEQYSTQPIRALPSSDALNLMLRVGTTRGPWSVDLFTQRSGRNRAQWVGFGNSIQTIDTIPGRRRCGPPPTRGSATAIPSGGSGCSSWRRPPASVSRRASRTSSPSNRAGSDTSSVPDSTMNVGQYLLSAGTVYGPFRVSATGRLRAFKGRFSSSPSARVAAETPYLSASVFAEASSPLSPSRIDATARLTPMPRVALLASASRTGSGMFERILGDTISGRTIDELGAYQPGPIFFYSGLRQPGGGSLCARDAVEPARGGGGTTLGLLGQRGFDPAGPDDPSPSRRAHQGHRRRHRRAIRGRSDGADRGRSRPAVQGALCGRVGHRLERQRRLLSSALSIPRRAVHPDESSGSLPEGKFRPADVAGARIPIERTLSTARDLVGDDRDIRTLAFRLEIRIQTAVVSYQFRNLLQERYAMVPGFQMPRQTQFYGVRWEFWN